MLALHRGWEDHRRLWFVADKDKVKKLTEAAAAKWTEKLKKGSVLRVTQAHSTDVVLLDLANRGVKIRYAHWHSTGVEKNLPSDQVALRFAALPDELFKEFTPRPDLANLRFNVDIRRAILDMRKADELRLLALMRNQGFGPEDKLPPALQDYRDAIDKMRAEAERPQQRDVEKIAAEVEECKIFNDVAGIADGYMTAGEVVSRLGDISRFPTVSSLWHYCGFHVVDGKSAKRKRGEAGSWNPRVRTALWNLGNSIIKNRENPWRASYERFRDEELAAHDVKCPNCKTKDGHCGARARRRVVKEILKEFYARTSGQSKCAIHERLAKSAA